MTIEFEKVVWYMKIDWEKNEAIVCEDKWRAQNHVHPFYLERWTGSRTVEQLISSFWPSVSQRYPGYGTKIEVLE